ncbi:MAG: InlB B-repeat-containing protein, partial [Oscillospiraceae bacterium]|nr:InlB B-repeat-containing protein [Oscillospiraceae bacterium]
EGYTFGGWYSDETLANSFDFATPITENTTLYAKWLKNCTVTYKDAEGNELAPSETVVEGTTVTLPEGYEWTYGDATYEPGTEVTITENTDFVGVLKTYTVTFVDENGNQTTQEVQYGKTITFADLPTGYVWAGSDGTDYPSGTESPEITGNMTFTATAKTITVSYDVNFPTSAELSAKYFALKTGESEATLVGDASVTLLPGSFAVIQNVSDQNVILYLTGHQNRYSAAHFLGWETETGAVISPDTKLDYAGLAVFDANGDGNVQLTGKWSYNQKTGVNFFVRYDIGSYDGDTSSTLYTDVVFTTYVGGLEDSDLGADALNTAYSKDASVKDTDGDGDLDAVLYKDDPTRYYEYDQLIRALYGEKADGVWLPEFPSDEDMLEVLKTKNTNNVIFAVEASTGNTVAVTDRSTLNTSNYTIRWYLFKYAFEGYGDYTWHIDGLLVKKQGQVTIDKEFLGDEAAIDAAEENFYVTAQNGTVTDGVFTPKTGDEAKSYTFDLSNTSSADAANHQYQWEISDVSLGEYWQITESASKVTVDGKEYIYYTEYSIYDSDGNITDIAEYGTTATVVGKTYAMDVDPDQGMLVEFKNYYYPSDTLLVKKEDADTGQPLGGAEFELWQYNTDGTPVQLKFSYNDALGMYQFDSTNGTVTTISTADTGYSNVALSGFSYEHGKVILKEVTAPSGYDPAPWIEIDTSGALSDVYYSDEDADDIASSDWGRYAEVHDDGHVLVVKDRTSEYVTVNVAKAWDPVDAAEENVTLVLQANGGRATNTFPTLSDAEVTIGEDDSWSYSWTGLPAFANGELVQWSVKEVAIGGEGTLTDGESFANWIYTASLTSRTDTNGNGIDDVWNYRVINTPRRTQIILTKTDVDGKALSGATFSLVEVELVDGEWQKVGIAARMTTNANGILSFDGLTAGAYYQLTETQAPDGYIAVLEPVVVTVNGEGLIQQVDSEGDPSELKGGYLIYTSAYNVQAVNLSAEPLPETGGAGTTVYTQCGLFLMLFALLIYKKPHRKEETDSS